MMTCLYDIEVQLSKITDLLIQLVENTKPVEKNIPQEYVPTKVKIDFYKLQGGIYKMKNGEYAFVRGFGELSGWGFNVTSLSSITYSWDTKDGTCLYRGGEENLDRSYDLVEYVGTDLEQIPNFRF